MKTRVLAALTATLALACTPTPAGASVIWGIHSTANLDPDHWTYIAQLEQKLGRPFAGFRKNGFTNDLAEARQNVDQDHRWTYVNGKPRSTSQKGRYWLDVANGRYDTAFRGFFTTVRDDARWTATNPFHYSFHHEQQSTAEGGGAIAGTASDYVKAYRHVSTLGRGILGAKLVMCWVPLWTQIYYDGTGKGQPAYYASKLWPGGAYVDLVGADIYNQASSNGTGLQYTAAQQWGSVHNFAVNVGKPFFTGETGVEVTGQNDAAVVRYLAEMDALLKQWGASGAAGQVVAINWTSRLTYPTTKHIDDRMDVRPVVLAKYRELAQDAFYSMTVE